MYIVSNNELGGSFGAYVASENKLFFNSDILNRKAYKRYLEQATNIVSKRRLTTVVHELIHWLDAENYRLEHGEITNSKEYIKKLDILTAKGYNISEISSYAEKMYYIKEYDEIYTEYRTKNILEGTK